MIEIGHIAVLVIKQNYSYLAHIGRQEVFLLEGGERDKEADENEAHVVRVLKSGLQHHRNDVPLEVLHVVHNHLPQKVALARLVELPEELVVVLGDDGVLDVGDVFSLEELVVVEAGQDGGSLVGEQDVSRVKDVSVQDDHAYVLRVLVLKEVKLVLVLQVVYYLGHTIFCLYVFI